MKESSAREPKSAFPNSLRKSLGLVHGENHVFHRIGASIFGVVLAGDDVPISFGMVLLNMNKGTAPTSKDSNLDFTLRKHP